MSFLESLKLEVKKKADFTCCYCHNSAHKVEIHHIIPQAEGGADTEDNAAPLCSNCHTMYGGNPELRKEIRLRRNHWYTICENRYQISLPGWVNESIPILNFARVYRPNSELPKTAIQFTDVDYTIFSTKS